MIDHVNPQKRSEIMAAVKNKNTTPEFTVRKLLHKAGFRFRLHRKDLPGKPDIVLSKYKAVILVHGCFWHGHDCDRSKTAPKTNTKFWKEKILINKSNDKKNLQALNQNGWRILTIWECALNRKNKIPMDEIESVISQWLVYGNENREIAGRSKTA